MIWRNAIGESQSMDIEQTGSWEFLGGIEFGTTATINAPDGEPVLRVTIGRTPALSGVDPNEAYRTIAKRFSDGSIKYLLIDFTEEHLVK